MFEQREENSKARFKFSATLDNLELCASGVKNFLARQNYWASHFEFLLVLREALLNAVIHASGKNPLMTVFCDISLAPDGAEIRVEDQGPGFDWRKTLEREPEECSESGRGLAIMRSYAKSVNYNQNGNILKIRFEADSRGKP